MRRKEAPPPIQVDTLDQKLLLDILGELQAHKRMLRAINQTVQFIGLIILLSIIFGCVAWLFGSSLF